jgi:hypothetical protein
MALEPSTGMDLTTSPADGDPSSDANPVVVSTFDEPDDDPPEASTPSTVSNGPVPRLRQRARLDWRRETSNLTVRIGLWPPRVDIALNVEGPLSWAAPLCGVLALAAGTYALVAEPLIALVMGASVLLVGCGVLLYLVRRGKPRTHE